MFYKGSSYLLGKRFRVCFVMKFAHQMGERKANFKRTFDPRNTPKQTDILLATPVQYPCDSRIYQSIEQEH